MTNPENKLSSIFKSLHTDSPDILEDAGESVSDEAQKWPLLKALAPRKPAIPIALTLGDKHNWLSAEPTPPPRQAAAPATNFSDRLAAGLGKMANPNKSAARKQVQARKVEPQPKATRAKPLTDKTTSVYMAQEASAPLSSMPPEQRVPVLKIATIPKALNELNLAPGTEPPHMPTVKRPSEPWGAASARFTPPASEQAAFNPKIETKPEPQTSATPGINSLLSLFNLEVPTVALDPPVTQETGTPEPSATQAGAELPNLSADVDAALPSSAPIEPAPIEPLPVETVPIETTPIKTMLAETILRTSTPPAKATKDPSEPIPAIHPSGTLKSLLNKLQASTNPPTTPAVKIPGFLNRLNKK